MLPTIRIEDAFHGLDGVEVTDGIGSASQMFARVFACHPLGDGNACSSVLDREEQGRAATNPSNDLKPPAEKRVDGVLDGYNTLVTGIIMFALATAATLNVD